MRIRSYAPLCISVSLIHSSSGTFFAFCLSSSEEGVGRFLNFLRFSRLTINWLFSQVSFSFFSLFLFMSICASNSRYAALFDLGIACINPSFSPPADICISSANVTDFPFISHATCQYSLIQLVSSLCTSFGLGGFCESSAFISVSNAFCLSFFSPMRFKTSSVTVSQSFWRDFCISRMSGGVLQALSCDTPSPFRSFSDIKIVPILLYGTIFYVFTQIFVNVTMLNLYSQGVPATRASTFSVACI